MNLPLPIKKALSFLPSRLPVGMAEFNQFANDIIELTGPIADEDSLKWVIASQIIGLNKDAGFISKRFFVKCLYKAAASQVASAVFHDIKTKQIAAAEAAKIAAETPNTPVEVTTDTTVVTNGEIKQS